MTTKLEAYLVGGRVRSLFTNEFVPHNADYDVVVVGTTYKKLLQYLIDNNVDIKVPNAEYIAPILNDEFEYDKFFVKSNANWTSFKTGVIKVGVKGTKSSADYVLARKDEQYQGNNVVPTGIINNDKVTLDEDLSRRDFKVNSMVLPLNNPVDLFSYDIRALYDPFNGLKDIDKRVINTVGRPLDRFIADPTRVLRLIKFMLRLDFDASIQIKMNLDEGLYKEGVADLIDSYKNKINDDRTVQELKHIFNSKHNVYKAIKLMYTLLPEDLINIIFNDNIYLQPTVIHNK